MSPAELLDRLRQHATARLDAARYRMGRQPALALRSPAPGEPPRFFFSTHALAEICQKLWQRLPHQANAIIARADKICEHRFDLLGYEDLDYGREIDWHCDRVHGKRAPRKPAHRIHYLDFAEVGDSKVTWELNRHQHLLTLAKAYRLTEDSKYASQLFAQWRHWHAENPYPIGINWASSLEAAFRSLSWLWMYFVLGDCPLAPPGFRDEWLGALGISGRHIELYLSTYFSPNTHLLGEAVALFFIGTLCPELAASPRWQRRGWDIVVQEMERQVRPDGLHFEQSTYYHVYALDFFLHARILAARNGITIAKPFDDKLIKMLDALALLSRSGSPPQLGDDDGGRLFDPRRNRAKHMLDPLATGAVLFQRGDWKSLAGAIREETLWLLGPDGIAEFDALAPARPTSSSSALRSGGLYLMSGTDRQLLIDAGPQGAASAGHGHADALSICLNLRGRPLLIDPGTCEYVGPAHARDLFRATSSHNTLSVDGLSQADPQGPFAWANLPDVRAEKWIAGRTFDFFAGSHTGYGRLPSPVIHRRTVFSMKDRFWLVHDEAAGSGEHTLQLHWHLSPDLTQPDPSRLVFACHDASDALAFVPLQGHAWTMKLDPGCYSPVYGVNKPAPLLHFSTIASLPAEFVTLLLAATGELGQLTRIPGAERAYRYRSAGEEYCIYFGRDGMQWTSNGWSSDADLLCWSVAGTARQLIVGHGSYVSYGGEMILSLKSCVDSCEVITSRGQTEVVSSDQQAPVLHRSLESISPDSEAALASVPGAGRTNG